MAIKGMKELQRKLSSLSKEGAQEFADITKINALEIQANAKRDAPIDTGDLRQSIVAIEETEYNWSVGSNLKYAPYMEFGTGKSVDIPEGFESLASQFKGKTDRQINIPPRPYLIPNFLRQKSQYIKDLSNAIKRLVK